MLRAIDRFALDADHVRVVAVLSGNASTEQLELCGTCARCVSKSEARSRQAACFDSRIRLRFTDLETLVRLNAGGAATAQRVMHKLATLRESTLTAVDDRGQTASLAMADGFFTQALKKLLGAAVFSQRCGVSWVLDAESLPFRPFRFASIFNEAGSSVYVIDAPSMAYYPPREGELLNRSARLLGMSNLPPRWGWPGAAPSEAPGLVYRGADLWIWRRSTLVNLLAHVRRVHGTSFVEAFAELPTHELVYYTFAEHLDRGDGLAFKSVRATTDAAFRAAGQGATPWRAGWRGCAASGVQLWEWRKFLQNEPEFACSLLATFGFAAVRYHYHSPSHPCCRGPHGKHCAPGTPEGDLWIRTLARNCSRGGRLAPADALDADAPTAGGRPLLSWWLSEAWVPLETLW